MSRSTGEPMWRLSSQKREIAITVGIADQGQAQQRKPRHFPPFGCPDPAPSVPRAWGFLSWNAGGDCGLAGSLSPRATAANAASAPQGMHASQLTTPMAPVLIPSSKLRFAVPGRLHFISSRSFLYARAHLLNLQLQPQPPLSGPFGIIMAQWCIWSQTDRHGSSTIKSRV